jgi:predicted amidohydrolase
MDKPIVACIQQHLIVPQTPDEYVGYLSRFLRTAKAKGAVLALFPELSGLVTAIPSLSGWRNRLLRTAGQSLNSKAGLWDRVKAAMAGSAASVMETDLGQALAEALRSMPEGLAEAFVSTYAGLARQFEMGIIVGTLLPGGLMATFPDGGKLYNVACVFDAEGHLLGSQAKVVPGADERDLIAAGTGWHVIPTPVGRVGLLIGEDALFPEAGRILAYQGADMLLTLAAVRRPATYQKIRQAALARCQENQLYGMVSFLTGPDPFGSGETAPFVGASAIFAPADFTRHFSGVMIEVGSPLAEGVITAEWDYPALFALWEESDTPLRRTMPVQQAGPVLGQMYARALPLATIPGEMPMTPALPASSAPAGEAEAMPSLPMPSQEAMTPTEAPAETDVTAGPPADASAETTAAPAGPETTAATTRNWRERLRRFLSH